MGRETKYWLANCENETILNIQLKNEKEAEEIFQLFLLGKLKSILKIIHEKKKII